MAHFERGIEAGIEPAAAADEDAAIQVSGHGDGLTRVGHAYAGPGVELHRARIECGEPAAQVASVKEKEVGSVGGMGHALRHDHRPEEVGVQRLEGIVALRRAGAGHAYAEQLGRSGDFAGDGQPLTGVGRDHGRSHDLDAARHHETRAP